MVVGNLSEFSALLGAGHLIPVHEKVENNKVSKKDVTASDDSICEKNKKINEVIVAIGGILLLIGLMILLIFILKWLVGFANDMLENIASEAADTTAGEKANAVKDIVHLFYQMCESPISIILPVIISCISLRLCFRRIKRIIKGY